MIHQLIIAPSFQAFSDKFAELLTPPYKPNVASSPAEMSVLNNVRMAYFNNDQLPIPSFTSAEGGTAHVALAAAREAGIIGRIIENIFVGSVDLRPESESLAGDVHSPLNILEPDSEFNFNAYKLILSEVEQFISPSEYEALAKDYNSGDAIVIAISEDVSEEEEEYLLKSLGFAPSK
ncbi:hypothetical protein [Marisediminicola antarctica]|uniref:Uncharacterized protein n=1 Tax=Marisediminicola antarctica TaxID=674079 RepID=A0A7L5AJ71_9MICO|nr:hypothetical protein [Marisediminicola antarctica]QHO70112.1 hypothetical protein BHD05_11145 [Marisediminicola antarctica]